MKNKRNFDNPSRTACILCTVAMLLFFTGTAYQAPTRVQQGLSPDPIQTATPAPLLPTPCRLPTMAPAPAPNPTATQTEPTAPSPTKRVSLTFDDGPRKNTTPKILDILQEKGVSATFFCIGARAESNPDIARRIIDEGHLLGNHTQNHKDLIKLTSAQIKEEIEEANRQIEAAGGEARYLRPPYGHIDKRVTRAMKESGMTIVCWNIDTRDWNKKKTDSIVANALKDAHDGGIILMHDTYPTSVEALPAVIDAMREKGYEFVRLDALLEGDVDAPQKPGAS